MSTSEAITSQFGEKIGENMRRILRQVLGQNGGQNGQNGGHVATAGGASGKAGGELRQSKGLREFCNAIHSPEGMQILDLGAASQANINFVTGLGHRVCTEDFHRCLELFSSRSMVTAD